MNRWLIIFACALPVVVASPIAFEGSAMAKSKAMMCKATGWDGKQSKWACKAGQKCCFNWLLNKGACVAASSICL